MISAEHQKRISESIKRFNLANEQTLLVKIFQHYRAFSYLVGFDEIQPDEDGPIYHGIMHSYLTALNCLEGAIQTGLGESECRAMLVAGLFHDAMHTQGGYNDGVNVEIAKKHLLAIHNRIPELEYRLNDEELKIALLAIRMTKFISGKYVGASNNVYVRIIRDADMMAVYCADQTELKNLLIGLHNEMNDKRMNYFEPELSKEEFMKQQLNFLGKVTWNTNWAKLKAMYLNWPQKCKQAVALLSPTEVAVV